MSELRTCMDIVMHEYICTVDFLSSAFCSCLLAAGLLLYFHRRVSTLFHRWPATRPPPLTRPNLVTIGYLLSVVDSSKTQQREHIWIYG